jgi:hypothetical protein
MREEQNWPRFELVTYLEPTGIPHGWDRGLVTLGVPKRIFGSYKALSHLELIDHPTLGPMVRFATVGRRGAMCLHPATRSIHWLTGSRSGQEHFVNTTLAHFNDSVRAVINMFPFDRSVPSQPPQEDASAIRQSSKTDHAEDMQWVIVGEELRELLRRIDPESVAHSNGFWNTFVTDVQMGNYSTDDVLRFSEEGPPILKRGTS